MQIKETVRRQERSRKVKENDMWKRNQGKESANLDEVSGELKLGRRLLEWLAPLIVGRWC